MIQSLNNYPKIKHKVKIIRRFAKEMGYDVMECFSDTVYIVHLYGKSGYDAIEWLFNLETGEEK